MDSIALTKDSMYPFSNSQFVVVNTNIPMLLADSFC